MTMDSLTNARDLGRVYDLASILVRYGFGDMVGRLRLERALQGAGKVLPLEQHRARLQDGTEVVVKVRRPGIRRIIEADMRLLQRVAGVIGNRCSSGNRASPPDLAMLIKVCITLEGMGRSLDPDFDMARQAAPFLRRAMRARYRPRVVARESLRTLMETAAVLSQLPHELRRMLRSVRTDNLTLHIDVRHLEQFSHQVDHSANRLTTGVVVAALIVGSSIAMTVEGGPMLLGLPTFALIGFIGAALAGVWLVFSIWRSGGGK